jgi:hypothetical protein
MESYADEIDTLEGSRIVDVLKVGRIALVYQTSDGEETGAWDVSQGTWVQLDDSYKTPIRNGIRMARKQLSVDMLTLPISGPEVVE